MESLAQDVVPVRKVYDFYLGTYQINVRRNHLQVIHLGRYYSIGSVYRSYHYLVKGLALSAFRRVIKSRRGVSLRVRIYNEHLLLQNGQRSGEIDGSGGFTHTALLICYCDNLSHRLQI